jgi:hypothetical protein
MSRAGVLAGWAKGFSAAIPQDLRMHTEFQVIRNRRHCLCFICSTVDAAVASQNFINALRRAAQHAHTCGAHSDAAVISTCVKSMGV